MHTVQDDRAEASDSGVELVRSLIIALPSTGRSRWRQRECPDRARSALPPAIAFALDTLHEKPTRGAPSTRSQRLTRAARCLLGSNPSARCKRRASTSARRSRDLSRGRGAIAFDGERSRDELDRRDCFARNPIARRQPTGRALSPFDRRAPRDCKGDGGGVRVDPPSRSQRHALRSLAAPGGTAASPG